jgi:hypothetical protein
MHDERLRPEQRAPETCPMCGARTRDGEAEVGGSELSYLLRFLWTTTENMPDDCYILLARIVGKMSLREISDALGKRLVDPSHVSIQKRASALALVFRDVLPQSYLDWLGDVRAGVVSGRQRARLTALAAMKTTRPSTDGEAGNS